RGGRRGHRRHPERTRRRARRRRHRARAGGERRRGRPASMGEAAARGLQGAQADPHRRRAAQVDDRQGAATPCARPAHREREAGEDDVKFGIFIPQGWRFDLVGIDPARHWGVMHDLAQAAEAGPWESLWVYDHFHTTPVPRQEATHKAWTLMAAFAASTMRSRLGQMCTCNGYRNPAYLAKVAATVDLISGGRLEMGIGAGWYEHEFRAYGYGFPDAPERLRMLRESVEIMHQAWTTGSATLDGEFYQVDGAIVQPRPLQEGGIPMWVAGGGEKVTLKIAAQYAKYTNFNGGAEVFA